MKNQALKEHEFTSSQDRKTAATNGRKGGIKSGEVRRTKRAYREIFESIRNEGYPATQPDGSIQVMPLDAAEMMALHLRAASGNTDALKMVLTIAGELDNKLTIESTEPGLVIRFGDTSGKSKPHQSRDTGPDETIVGNPD